MSKHTPTLACGVCVTRKRGIAACFVLGAALIGGGYALGRLHTANPAVGRFTAVAPIAAAHRGPALSFLAVGDTGYANAGQRRVAHAMSVITAFAPIDLVLLLGDNFYPDGIQSATDPQWARRFEDVYRLPGLAVPFYAVLGNHDHHSNVTAQIERTAIDPRWRMPANYYSWTAPIDDKHEVLFVALDTIVFDQPEKAREQLDWLESTLAGSHARWTVALGHEPILMGSDGRVPARLAPILPILDRHHAAFYLSGHRHEMAYFKRPGGVNEIISGAGGKMRPLIGVNGAAFASDQLGVAWVNMTADAIDICFVNTAGQVLFTDEVQHPSFSENP